MYNAAPLSPSQVRFPVPAHIQKACKNRKRTRLSAFSVLRALRRPFVCVRVRGIELRSSPWQGDVLPLNYTRTHTFTLHKQSLCVHNSVVNRANVCVRVYPSQHRNTPPGAHTCATIVSVRIILSCSRALVQRMKCTWEFSPTFQLYHIDKLLAEVYVPFPEDRKIVPWETRFHTTETSSRRGKRSDRDNEPRGTQQCHVAKRETDERPRGGAATLQARRTT